MRTPEGWARANLLLKTLQAPPPKGSLRESVLMLLLMKQETIEHARFRALSQIVIDKEKGVEAFEEYMKIAFPYLEATNRRDRDKYIAMLNQEVRKGALRVHAVQEPKGKSRMKQKAVEAKKKRDAKQMNSLYSKLGSVIPK